MTTNKKARTTPLKIGNAGGYWGDDPKALARQVNGGRLDYITIDFLAEVTMSIMQKQRSHDPALGYARDFITMLEPVLPKLLKDRTKIITNAGGVNPESCAAAIATMASKIGLSPKISIVYGDDILPIVADLRSKGCEFTNMENGQAFADVATRLEAANVYFGAAPVVEALADDPDIIITGRVTDTGITLAAMVYEFGWDMGDWDRLAAGIVAGHIIECGSQSTGGNFTDWRQVESWDQIGYPIIEMNPDGTFVVTKHPGTGGLVSADTVREQLFYEMGNPVAYITPDVVADFATIQVKQEGLNRVRISGVRGYEPTPFYKVSMAYGDGFKCLGSIAISGPDARAKAETFAKIFWTRVGSDFTETSTEYYGWNACHRSLGGNDDGSEILLRLGARSPDASKLKNFSKAIPALILGGPPGVCVLGGAPKPTEVVSYWPALMPKTVIRPKIAAYDGGLKNIRTVAMEKVGNFIPREVPTQTARAASMTVHAALGTISTPDAMPLSEICLGRSGDKGDAANIGIMARGPLAFKFLDEFLTAQRVKDLFQELCIGPVVRYKLENMLGFNFLLENALGGGGTVTLRTDAQGKTFAQALLRQKVRIPREVLAEAQLSRTYQ